MADLVGRAVRHVNTEWFKRLAVKMFVDFFGCHGRLLFFKWFNAGDLDWIEKNAAPRNLANYLRFPHHKFSSGNDGKLWRQDIVGRPVCQHEAKRNKRSPSQMFANLFCIH